MKRPASTLLIALLALASRGLAADEGLKPWDQERVTELAVELEQAARDVREAYRRLPIDSVGTQRRSHEEYGQALRALETSSRQLAARLRSGGGREETLPIARKMRTQLHDARELARSLMETAQMQAAYAPANRLIDELAPYYFPPEPAAE